MDRTLIILVQTFDHGLMCSCVAQTLCNKCGCLDEETFLLYTFELSHRETTNTACAPKNGYFPL